MNTYFVLLSLAAIFCALLYALLYGGGGVNEEIKAGHEQVLDSLTATLIRNK
jgi:hypothetical protein